MPFVGDHLVGDHGGQAYTGVWACEALEDHREVAGAIDTKTDSTSQARWTRNPEQGYQSASAHKRSQDW